MDKSFGLHFLLALLVISSLSVYLGFITNTASFLFFFFPFGLSSVIYLGCSFLFSTCQGGIIGIMFPWISAIDGRNRFPLLDCNLHRPCTQTCTYTHRQTSGINNNIIIITIIGLDSIGVGGELGFFEFVGFFSPLEVLFAWERNWGYHLRLGRGQRCTITTTTV